MPKFTFDDTVRVLPSAPAESRPGQLASVIMIFSPSERSGRFFDRFPEGIVYSIEFEDGEAILIHEDLLVKDWFPSEREQN